MMNSNSGHNTNAVDLILRYGAAFFAAAYALGIVKEIAVLTTVGAMPTPIPWTDSANFLKGIITELLCTSGTLIAILAWGLLILAYLLFSERPVPNFMETQKKFSELQVRAGLVVYLVSISSVTTAVLFRFRFGFSIRTALGLALASTLVNMVVFLALLKPDTYFSSTFRQQLCLLSLVGISLIVFSAGDGVAVGRQLLREPGKSARLLIAPEAIDGLRLLGVPFADVKGAMSAGLTDKVNVLSESTGMYIIRLKNGDTIQIKNDKVWSVAR